MILLYYILLYKPINQPIKMSIAFKFNTAPDYIHWTGNIAPEIWDIIFTFKEAAEERDFIQPLIEKFKAIGYEAITGRHAYGGDRQEEYCQKNKIAQTWNGGNSCFWKMRDVAIVFDTFNMKLPSARSLPKEYKKKGMTLEIVKKFWGEEEKNLYMIAKSFTTYIRTRCREREVSLMMEEWEEDGLNYTGLPQFIQMGQDMKREWRERDDVKAFAMHR